MKSSQRQTEESNLMCTYVTEQAKIAGSGKGQRGWFKLTDAQGLL